MNVLRIASDRFIAGLLGLDPATWANRWTVDLGFILVAAILSVTFVALFAGPLSWLERRIAGRIMSRIGPNRVGPQGALQWLADGIKCFLKEDLIPDGADRVLYRIAPYFVFAGMFGAFVILPFGAHLIAADLNVGVLYLLAITSLVVVGLLMAGWASNSKWALFGGVRASAQLVSYEIPSAFSLMAVILVAGTLSMQGIVQAQGGWPWQWFLLRNPFLFAAFFLYFTSAIAEGNRTPFDLPEAESEIVAGYNVEYSGMRFLFFLFAEWANLWIMSAVATVCFLGGWQIPGVSPERIAAADGLAFAAWQLLSFVVFAAKASTLVFIVVQLRWTLPRLRVDQLMMTCWKYLVPLSVVSMFGVLILMATVREGGAVDWALRAGMTLLVAAILVAYARKVRRNYLVDRESYEKMEGKELWYPPYRLP
ncbi:MAG: NADH-quinone oxidoreductase subunit NuoH [Deltaproteobacteria bacterium]|nr:NADH-quinone oxidoreductase subunit NuoH [Deltaproteobacteria bacterium]